MLSVSGSAAAPADIDARRQAFRGLMQFSGRLAEVGAVEDRALPGPAGPIGCRLYTPDSMSDGLMPGLVFFHGGGLVAGSVETHDPLCRALANAGQCRVISVDYRLAPEHKFPAAAEDARTAWSLVLEQAAELGLDAARLGVAGDSAGATLAIGTCVDAGRSGGRMPAFQLLLCPITDFADEMPSRDAFASGYLIDRAMIREDLRHYLPAEVDAADPRISPLRLDSFAGLPQAFIHTAEFDPFRDEGEAYAGKLRDAGVAVAYTCHPGMVHLFYAMPGVIPSAREALTLIGSQIRAMFEP